MNKTLVESHIEAKKGEQYRNIMFLCVSLDLQKHLKGQLRNPRTLNLCTSHRHRYVIYLCVRHHHPQQPPCTHHAHVVSLRIHLEDKTRAPQNKIVLLLLFYFLKTFSRMALDTS